MNCVGLLLLFFFFGNLSLKKKDTIQIVLKLLVIIDVYYL